MASGSNRNVHEIQSVNKGSQGSFMQLTNEGCLMPMHQGDSKESRYIES